MEWTDRAREADATLAWISDNLPADGKIASSNSALLFLRTGLKSLAYDDPTIPLQKWRSRGFRYIVCLRPLEVPVGPPGSFRLLYHSSQMWVIEINEAGG